MMNNLKEYKNAGFWIRFLATWLDCVLIYIVLKLLFYALFLSSIYIYSPFEFTFFISGILYSTFLIALNGQTAGKWLLGLKVSNKKNEKLSIIQSIFRESILKIFSGLILFLGFIWIGFSRTKKGWHDYFSRSKVIRATYSRKRILIWKIIAITSFIILSGKYLWNIGSMIYDAKKISITQKLIDLPFINRNPSTLAEVSESSDTLFSNWVKRNAQTPEHFAIQIAATHQLTLFGEMHNSIDNLRFFNRIIDSLYYKSGIRCIAMEVIPSCMNDKLQRLVNGNEYNYDLALEIARSQGWKVWGDKEYWDVLETVWKLNKGLPEGFKKMRIVGIDTDWEGPNIAMLNIGDDKKGPTPFWEKFRIVSVIKDIHKLGYREEIMARNVEKEIIEKGEKGVVLIGFAHSMLQYGRPIIKENKIIAINPRFGLLLSQKYKDRIFQIELFLTLGSQNQDTACHNKLDHFIESVMSKNNFVPAGFSIINSPFEKIRDSCSEYFNTYPSVCYGDIAQGLIFLKPLNEMQNCTWLKGYISNKMFMKYKAYYELIAKQKFNNAEEANNQFAKGRE